MGLDRSRPVLTFLDIKLNRDNAMGQITILMSVGLGGAFGACARYLLSKQAGIWFGTLFPYGTLMVNVIGAFIMGLVIALVDKSIIQNEALRLLISVGFLGALTTYSTFSLDTLSLIQQQEIIKAGVNILANTVLSISAVYVGMWLVR